MTGANYGCAAGAAAVVITWLLAEFFMMDMPDYVVAALTGLLSWSGERIGGWLDLCITTWVWQRMNSD